MKIFENNTSSWDDKVNFVDENDVFVGYDIGQSCCEDAGWFIDNHIIPYDYDYKETKFDIEQYSFDITFFQEVESEHLDSGGMVVFKLVAKGKPNLYLHIFNSHNGYYGHGFEVKHNGTVVKEGTL